MPDRRDSPRLKHVVIHKYISLVEHSVVFCLQVFSVLDGIYRTTEGLPVFHEVGAPTAEQLRTLLARIIKRLMNRMHRDVQL